MEKRTYDPRKHLVGPQWLPDALRADGGDVEVRDGWIWCDGKDMLIWVGWGETGPT